MAKKHKQNAARDRNYGEYAEISKLLDKIRSVGMGGILSLIHIFAEVAAISPRPAFPKHIALAIQRQAAAGWCQNGVPTILTPACGLPLFLSGSVLGPQPVSYTHLDVYKRQPFPTSLCTEITPF